MVFAIYRVEWSFNQSVKIILLLCEIILIEKEGAPLFFLPPLPCLFYGRHWLIWCFGGAVESGQMS